MVAGTKCVRCEKYSADGKRSGDEFVCNICIEEVKNAPVARKTNNPTEKIEIKVEDALKAREQQKKKMLKEVHKLLKKMKKEDRVAWIEKYDKRICDRAKSIRVTGKIGRHCQLQIEQQVAQRYTAVQYNGYWVQAYLGEIPILVKETIDELCQKDQK